MERKKRFRRATKESAQIKRIGAEELAQEFPDGAYNAPPIRSDRNERNRSSKDEKRQE